MSDRITGLLISGTSHVGKSTFAEALGADLGWAALSTDKLARHPGRPWPTVRPHVAEFFAQLTPDTIHQFLLDHHWNMWPGIRRIIADHLSAGTPFVFEGAALRPEYLATEPTPGLLAVCLHADDAFLAARMRAESGHDHRDPDHRLLIDRFIDRSLRDNAALVAAARANGQRCIDVADPAALPAFRSELEQLLVRE